MNGISSISIGHRTFLKISASVILATAFNRPALAVVNGNKQQLHALSFFNVHTGEAIRTCYHSNGKLIDGAIKHINHNMRDYRTGAIRSFDPKLLDLLDCIVSKVPPRAPIRIISGYRSPSTNAALRKITKGVSPKSRHMEGRAIDIRHPGYDTSVIRDLAIQQKSGGVGYYPKSDFIHLDTGPVKFW